MHRRRGSWPLDISFMHGACALTTIRELHAALPEELSSTTAPARDKRELGVHRVAVRGDDEERHGLLSQWTSRQARAHGCHVLSLLLSPSHAQKVCELRGDVHGETRRRSRMKTERRLQFAECYDGDGDEQLELLSQQLCLRASTCSRRALSLARVPLASQRNLRVAR